MDFQETERKFFELKGRLDAGAMTQQEFEARLRELTVLDANGRTWTLGAQTGQWYYAEGVNWVPGVPPGMAVPAAAAFAPHPGPPAGAPPVDDYVPPPTSRGPGLLWLVAGGCFAVGLCAAGVVAAALFLPQSPFRGLLVSGTATSTPSPATRLATATPVSVPPTGTRTPPSVTPVPPTAPAKAPTVTATRTLAVPTATATRPVATATPTRIPATSTPTRVPPTATPVPSEPTPWVPPPVDVTLSNPHYERWGRPTDSTGCRNYNNGSPVRRFTIQLIVKNNTGTAIAKWDGPYYTANTGKSLARCYYPYDPNETSLPAIGANATNNVTFVSFTDEGTYVSRVEFRYSGRTWVWTLGPDGQIWSYP